MSKNVKSLNFIKNIRKTKKNRKYIRSRVIEYNKKQYEVEFLQLMKNGYEEMAQINLELSQLPFECEIANINEYEKWLCGVWYFLMTTMVVKRGDIFYADLSPVIGSEQGGIRPVIIVQNDIGNKYSPTVIVAAITSQINKAKLPTHVEISSEEYGLNRDSVVLLEQIRTLDKRRLKEKIGHMTDVDMKKVNKSLLISLSLT